MELVKSSRVYDESMLEWNPTCIFDSLFYAAVVFTSNSSLYIPRLQDMHGYYLVARKKYNYEEKTWHIYSMAFDDTNLCRGQNSRYNNNSDEILKRDLSACILALHNK